MSASTDRKKRQDAIAAGTDKKTIAQQKEELERKKSKRKWALGGIIVAVLIALIILVNTNFFYRTTTAVKVGDTSYSAAQVDYYFYSQYSSFMNQYGSYASMFGLDTSSSLKSQECTMLEDGGTWFDYFMEQAEEYMKQVTAYSKYAEENGIELGEEETSVIDTQMESYETEATSNGYSSVDKYLQAVYGKGCNAKIVREEMERIYLASKALEAVQDSFEYTDEQIQAEYAENKDDYDKYSYAYYFVAAETETVESEDASSTEDGEATTEEAVTEETMEVAKNTADAIAAAVSGADGLDAAVQQVVTDDESAAATTQTLVQGSNLSSLYADWLKDSSRQAGDVTVIESEDSGYYVVVFQARDDNNYNLRQVRHILTMAVADSDGEYTEEALAAAKEKAEEIYNTWLEGDQTEESFAELAKTNSEDSGSADNGGLYDTIYKGQMVPEFDAWTFDSSRQYGDTGIVYGESEGSYAGYHVMYYVGEGELYSSYLARNALLSEDLENWQTEQTENMDVKERFSIKFVQA